MSKNLSPEEAEMNTFFAKMRTLDGQEGGGRAAEVGVYHVNTLQKGQARLAAVKAERAHRRRSLKQAVRKMSHRQMKKDGLYDFELRGCGYKDFLPVHVLWTQYMERLLGKMGPSPSLEQVGTKVLKADWHGAFVVVAESSTPSVVGHSGILLVERKNTLLLVTKRNELVLIPKHGSVFVMQVGKMVLRLFGDSLKVRSTERSVQKFRQKH